MLCIINLERIQTFDLLEVCSMDPALECSTNTQYECQFQVLATPLPIQFLSFASEKVDNGPSAWIPTSPWKT